MAAETEAVIGQGQQQLTTTTLDAAGAWIGIWQTHLSSVLLRNLDLFFVFVFIVPGREHGLHILVIFIMY